MIPEIQVPAKAVAAANAQSPKSPSPKGAKTPVRHRATPTAAPMRVPNRLKPTINEALCRWTKLCFG